MRLVGRRISALLAVVLALGVLLQPVALAASGSRLDPYSGYVNRTISVQEYSFDEVKKVQFTLLNVYVGDEASSIVHEENEYNEVPSSDEQWVLMQYHFKYISGPEEELFAGDVVSPYGSYYAVSGAQISAMDYATFSGEREGLDDDFSAYPGGESDVWYGILIKKSVGYPLYRIPVGYDEDKWETIYAWFSTDPSFEESVTPAKPSSVKATVSAYNAVKVSWGSVGNASGYEVYRSTKKSAGYSLAKSLTGTAFTNSGLKTGTTYYYKVRAYRNTDSGKSYGAWSSVVSAKPKPAAPTEVKAKRVSNSSIKVSWKKVSGATKYQVYRATSKTGTYTKVKETTSLSCTNKGLKDGKKYYYKVRAYRLVGSTKVYGSYSSVVSAKP